MAKKRGGASELSRLLAIDLSTVKSWLKGQCKPSGAVRTRLAADLGIRREAWDELAGPGDVAAPGSPAPPPPPPALPPAPIDGTAAQLARYQVTRIQIELDYRRQIGISPTALASLEGQYNSAIKTLSKLTGETDISVAQILRSEAWRRILGAVRKWLEENGEGKVSRLVEHIQRLVDDEGIET